MIARIWRGVIRAEHAEKSVLYPEDQRYLIKPSTITPPSPTRVLADTSVSKSAHRALALAK